MIRVLFLACSVLVAGSMMGACGADKAEVKPKPQQESAKTLPNVTYYQLSKG